MRPVGSILFVVSDVAANEPIAKRECGVNRTVDCGGALIMHPTHGVHQGGEILRRFAGLTEGLRGMALMSLPLFSGSV